MKVTASSGLVLVHVSSSGTNGGSYVTAIATRPSWSLSVTERG